MTDVNRDETPTNSATTPPSRRGFIGVVTAVLLVVASLGVAFVLSASRHGATGGAYGTPSARTQAALAYDPATKTVILFGGRAADGSSLGDTWQWDGSGWTQLHPGHSPTAREAALIGFDPASGDVVLFGGSSVTSVTTKGIPCPAVEPGIGVAVPPAAPDAAGTTSVKPAIPPPPSGVPVPCRAIESNGLSTSYQDISDTWTWDGSDWSKAASSGPTGRLSALATDSATGHLYGFAYGGVEYVQGSGGASGGGGSGSSAGGTAVGGNTTSSGSIPPAAPSQSTVGHSATSNQATTICAAPMLPERATPLPAPTCLPTVISPPMESVGVQVYTWNGGWKLTSTTGTAPNSLALVLADPVSGAITVSAPQPYMGCPLAAAGVASNMLCNPCGQYGITQGQGRPAPALGAPSIACRAPAPCPANADCATLAPQAGAGAAICCPSQTYTFDGHRWTMTSGISNPPGLATYPGATAAVTEIGRGDAIGVDASGNTWRWLGAGSSWTELHPATHAPAVSGFAMAYDQASQQTLQFGGQEMMKIVPSSKGSGIPLSSATWLWNGTTWSQAGTPQATAAASPTATATPSTAPSSTPCLLPASVRRDIAVPSPSSTELAPPATLHPDPGAQTPSPSVSAIADPTAPPVPTPRCLPPLCGADATLCAAPGGAGGGAPGVVKGAPGSVGGSGAAGGTAPTN